MLPVSVFSWLWLWLCCGCYWIYTVSHQKLSDEWEVPDLSGHQLESIQKCKLPFTLERMHRMEYTSIVCSESKKKWSKKQLNKKKTHTAEKYDHGHPLHLTKSRHTSQLQHQTISLCRKWFTLSQNDRTLPSWNYHFSFFSSINPTSFYSFLLTTICINSKHKK